MQAGNSHPLHPPLHRSLPSPPPPPPRPHSLPQVTSTSAAAPQVTSTSAAATPAARASALGGRGTENMAANSVDGARTRTRLRAWRTPARVSLGPRPGPGATHTRCQRTAAAGSEKMLEWGGGDGAGAAREGPTSRLPAHTHSARTHAEKQGHAAGGGGGGGRDAPCTFALTPLCVCVFPCGPSALALRACVCVWGGGGSLGGRCSVCARRTSTSPPPAPTSGACARHTRARIPTRPTQGGPRRHQPQHQVRACRSSLSYFPLSFPAMSSPLRRRRG